jgi:hypothetical protein
VPQLRDREFQVLDLTVEGARTGLGVIRALRRGDQHGLERCDIVRKLCRIEHHGREHSCFAPILISTMTKLLGMSCGRHTEASRSPGDFRPPCVQRRAPVDPLKHVSQLRRGYRHRAFGE